MWRMSQQTCWNKLNHGATERMIHFAYCCSFTSVWLRQTTRLDQRPTRPVLSFPVFFADWPYCNLAESFSRKLSRKQKQLSRRTTTKTLSRSLRSQTQKSFPLGPQFCPRPLKTTAVRYKGLKYLIFIKKIGENSRQIKKKNVYKYSQHNATDWLCKVSESKWT